MTTNSVKKLIREYKRELASQYPEHEIMQMLYLLFEEFIGWHKTRVHLSFDAIIPGKEILTFNRALTELVKGKPIQYVLGWTLFNGNKIVVNDSVLIPRPETEELVLLIKSDLHLISHVNLSILDVGTGSGCISIALKRYFPGATITGIDKSQAAIDIARLNAGENSCDIAFMQSDILDQNNSYKFGIYNVIVSNPPYVTESEKQFMHKNVLGFEPSVALFVPDSDPLLYYRAISAFASNHLTHQGYLYFEINEKYGLEVCQLIETCGLVNPEIFSDINGKNRFVRAFSKAI